MKDNNKTKKQLINELAELRQQIAELEALQIEPKWAEEELRRSQEEMAHKQQLLLALGQAAQAVQQARAPDDVYQAVAREVAGLGYHAFIFTLSDDQNYLTLSYISIESGLLQATEKLAGITTQGYRREIIPGDIYDQVLGENQTLFVENMADRLADALPRPTRPLARRIVDMLGLERGIYAPLITGDQTFGLLIVAGSNLTETDLPLVTAFANQTAIALENTQLYQALRKSEEQYRALVEHQGEGIGIIDPEEQFIFANPAAHEIFGVPPESLVGRNLQEFIDEGGFAAAQTQAKLRQTGQASVYELEIIRADGQRRSLLVTTMPQFNQEGQLTGKFGVFRDITERKQAEAALERRVTELSAFNAMATIVSQSLDVEQILNRAIDEMLRLVGIEAAGFYLLDETAGELKLTTHRGVSEEFAQTFSSLKLDGGVVGKVAQTGKPILLSNLEDYLGVKKAYIGNGRLQSVAIVPLIGVNRVIGTMNLATTSPKYFDAAGLELLSGLGRQIAVGIEKARLYAETHSWAAELEQRVKERTTELADSEARYHTLFDSARDALTVIDMQGHYLDVNPAACQLFGYSREELLTMDVSQVGVRGRDASLEEKKQLLKQRQALWRQGASEYKTQSITKTGEVVDLEITITPLIYDRQEAVLGVMRDISRRVQAEREIQQWTEDLALINALNEASNRGESLQEIISLLTRETQRIFSGNGATVYLLSEDKKHLTMQNFTLPPTMTKRVEKLIGLSIPSLEISLETSSLYAELLKAGQPRFNNNPETIQQIMAEFIEAIHPSERLRKRLQRFIPQIQKILDIQSVIDLPLVSEGEIVGLLDISRSESFREADLHRLMTIASQLTAIIKRKQTEEALRESEEKYRQLFEAESDAIFLIDNETGQILEVNAAGSILYGYSREELRQKKNTDLSAEPRETRKATVEGWTRVPVRFHRKKDGTIFPVEITGCHFSWRGGGVHIAAIRDITERTQAEEALRCSQREWESTFNVMSDWISLLDLDSRILRSNRVGENFTGIPQAEIVGQTCCKLVHGSDEPIPECPLQKMLQTHQRETAEFQVPDKNRWLMITVEPVKDVDGNLTSAVHIVRDITERKLAEETLKKYSEQLEEMVEERTQELREAQEQLVRREKLAVLGQLAGSVAHELRNPLGVIKNSAYFLNMILDDSDPEVKHGLQILNREVGKSDQIIKSLLDFARSKPPDRQEMNVNDVVRETLSQNTVIESIEVVSQLDETLPTIFADPTQLRQVFDNLIRNAIQAMPEGGRLVVETSEVSENLPKSEGVAISITDTGVGIPQENLAKLFEPLFTTKSKGIGLGLALVKNLVEGNGGTIEVKSEVGRGSTFTVRLPLDKDLGTIPFK